MGELAGRGRAGMWPVVERVEVKVTAENRSEDGGAGSSNGTGPVPAKM